MLFLTNKTPRNSILVLSAYDTAVKYQTAFLAKAPANVAKNRDGLKDSLRQGVVVLRGSIRPNQNRGEFPVLWKNFSDTRFANSLFCCVGNSAGSY
jgi:hypothetical protein